VTDQTRARGGKGAPLVIAHRGYSHAAPENTLAAIRLGLVSGAELVEIDVRLTRDGVPVLMHDDGLRRTAGRSERVRELDAAEVASLDAGSWFSPQFAKERVPTLTEALDIVTAERPMLVEIKEADAGEATARAISAAGAVDRVVIQSFLPEALAGARKALPEAPIGLLLPALEGYAREAQEWVSEVSRRVAVCGGCFAAVAYPAVGPRLVEYLARRGQSVWAWTVDSEERMIELASWGVGGIITNVPTVALGLREK
jgi:glycerophosphoryl diester phosphodiesterase